MKTQIRQKDIVAETLEGFGRELFGAERGPRTAYIGILEDQNLGMRRFAFSTELDAAAASVAVGPGCLIGSTESPITKMEIKAPRGKLLKMGWGL